MRVATKAFWTKPFPRSTVYSITLRVGHAAMGTVQHVTVIPRPGVVDGEYSIQPFRVHRIESADADSALKTSPRTWGRHLVPATTTIRHR